MAVHAYKIDSVTVLSWLYILCERKNITVVQDIRSGTTNNQTDGPVFTSIVLEFPGYNTWLEFQAMIRNEPIKWNNVFGDKEYSR